MVNSLRRWFLCITFFLILSLQLNAQALTGTKTIGTDYPTIAAAISALNTNGVGAGGVIFNIPAGYTETLSSPTACNITSNTGTASNTIVFQKSGPGANPVITGGVGAGTGDYIIKLNGVSYITFDGIDLQESGANITATTKMEYGYYIVNASTISGSQHNTIQNCVVTLDNANTSATYGVYQSNGATTTSIYNSYNTYKNIAVQKAYYGIYIKGNSTYSDVGCTVQNCIIGSTVNSIGGTLTTAADVFGIGSAYQNGASISNNEVKNVTFTNTATANCYGIYSRYSSGTTNIFNNKVHDVSNNLSSGSPYSAGIIVYNNGATDIMNVFNNVVYAINNGGGMASGGAASTRIMGLYNNGVGIVNFYFNSVYLMNTANVTYIFQSACLYISGGPTTVNIKNNLLKNAWGSGSTQSNNCMLLNNGTGVISDYNIFDSPATGVAYSVSTGSGFVPASLNYSTLANWQAASGSSLTGSPDVHSKQIAIDYTNLTAGSENLHLNLSSINTNYIGTPISTPSITTDIDGETRNATYPYIGADENLTYVLPVELTSFTAIAKGRGVELAWKTATEINNAGFAVEQKDINNNWNKIGYVEGSGTTNAPQSYSFIVKVSTPQKYQFRLKQIDRDGKFTYSGIVEATTAFTADDYKLSQNYPNPFNPSTTFSFAMKNTEQTMVKVYNLVGQEVATLFDGIAQPNHIYTVKFDAKNLPSGMYFYSLQSNSKNEVKKMMLMK
jgi:hypothetical protein